MRKLFILGFCLTIMSLSNAVWADGSSQCKTTLGSSKYTLDINMYCSNCTPEQDGAYLYKAKEDSGKECQSVVFSNRKKNREGKVVSADVEVSCEGNKITFLKCSLLDTANFEDQN